ncbi:hypothetical protein NLI96_g12320 [Meripilus lineatus]|uniref:Uncharacterized protein n=1 Tax=Meripilus lineatus TaxID=2056292 RepID=A0AAD5Y8A9_9APHY|nr:hypothetical protein NLI96_g12320 [Physisporinus lineatus]
MVEVLVFNGTQSLSFNDYVYFQKAFINLIDVRMLDARWLPNSCTPQEATDVDSVRRKITTLELSKKIDVVTLVDWLMERSRCAELRTFSCFLTNDASAKAIKQLLQSMGSTLENLSIGFSDTRDPTGESEPFQRHELENLPSRIRNPEGYGLHLETLDESPEPPYPMLNSRPLLHISSFVILDPPPSLES